MLLCTRPRDWPYFLVAVFLGSLFAGSEPVAVNLLYSSFNVIEPLLVAIAVTKFLGVRPGIDSVASALGLIVLTLAVMAVAILVDNSIDWLIHPTEFWRTWVEWYLSNVLGMLVFAPFVMALSSDLRMELANATRARKLEAASILAGLLVAASLPYLGPTLLDKWLKLSSSPLLAPSLFLMWGALRFALPGGTASLVILTLLTMAFTGHNAGVLPAPDQDPAPALFHLQVNLVVITITVLMVSSVAKEWRSSRNRLDRALESARLALFEVDLASDRVYLSEGWAEMIGAGRGETHTTARQLLELVHPDERKHLLETGSEVVSGKRDVYEMEHRMHRRDGQWIWILSRGRIVERHASGRALRIAGTNVEITERKLTEQRLHYLATRDTLTDLTNRALFGDRVQRAVEEARLRSHRVAVISVGLDRFTAINDSLGHQTGDQVLKSVAIRITSVVGAEITVARPGGDEFLVLMPAIHSPHEASEAAEDIRAAISRPIHIDRHELVVTAGIGAALYPDDGDSAGQLLRNADIALHSAKAAGQNNVQFFAERMNIAAKDRMEMEQALRRGLERDQFIVHYQPEIELATGALIGFEALARWRDPDRGLVSPQDFIPAAEAMGLMVAFGERILTIACHDAALWQRASRTRIRVAVNVSPSQLRYPGFAKSLEDTLAATGLDPRLLELEITEGSIMEHGAHTMETLAAIGRLGVQIAVDDFGTGYSSLGYLKRLPIDKVKIDRSFVSDLPGDVDAGAIVDVIIALSHSLGFKVIAEGVETQAQVEYLRDRGCDHAQGYFFGRPQPYELLELDTGPPRRDALA